MKIWMPLLILFITSMAHAGKVKSLHLTATESALATLGFDEGMVEVVDAGFVPVEGADLALRTSVRVIYTGEVYQCLSIFAKAESSYVLKQTRCQ